MTDKLRIRAYNVLFGDAILLSIPDRDEAGHTEMRHLLIDVGNAYRDKAGGSDDRVFQPILQNISAELAGKPLDLYVLTHEHLDHVQGLRHAAEVLAPPITFPIDYAWVTASADPNYHTRFPGTEEIKKLVRNSVADMRTLADILKAAGEELSPQIPLLLDVNDPGLTDNCVLYILNQASHKQFVHRRHSLKGRHPFHEVKFDIWAPEENTAVYYHAIPKTPLALDGIAGSDPAVMAKRIPPPPGVDASAFNNLLEIRLRSFMDTLLCIDKAANNTSVVFTLEWRGWKLLFAGDAEQRSWEMMDRKKKLSAVDFIKISHHGSQTGIPPLGMLHKLFPPGTPKQRLGLISTYRDTYTDVPADEALKSYDGLPVQLISVGDSQKPENCEPGKYIDFYFPEYADAPEIDLYRH